MTALAQGGGWTAGTLIGLPLLAVLLLAVAAFAALAFYEEGPLWGVTVLLGGWLFFGTFGAIGFYPFQKAYHYWTPVTGTVAEVDKRLVRDGGGMSEKVVIRFEDDPQQYGIEDTRAALLRKGDEASLLCKKAHQWGPSVDGFDCRWGGGAP